jgi:hypothetical protein
VNYRARFWLAALLAAAAWYPAPLRADLAWTERLTTLVTVEGKPTFQGAVQTRVALKGDIAKLEDRDQAGIRFYNFANQSAVFLSLKTQTFMTVSFRDLLEQARAQEAGIRKSLDSREAAAIRNSAFDSGKITQAQVVGQRKRFALEGQPFRLEAGRETKTLLGHPCRRYRGYAGTDNYLEVWVAEDLKPDPAFRQYAESMTKADPVGSQHLLAVPGFPLSARLRFGPVEMVWEVQSLSLAPLPVAEFLLPPGAQPALPSP